MRNMLIHNGTKELTAQYLVVAEGGRSQTLDDIGWPAQSHSPLKSERVTFYWDTNPPTAFPKFSGMNPSFCRKGTEPMDFS